MGTQKIETFDQESFIDRSKRSENDSFVVEIESLSIGNDKDVTANSRYMLQRSLSRKGYQRGERKSTSITTSTSIQKDTVATITSAEASYKGGAVLVGPGPGPGPGLMVGTGSVQEKSIIVPVGVGMGKTEPANEQVHMVTTSTPTATAESRYKRYGGRRSSSSSSSWIVDPRRMLCFFATLSSMGTIILIYFTLSIARLHEDGISQTQ